MVGNERKRRAAAVLCVIIGVLTLVGCKKEAPTEGSEEETVTAANVEAPPAISESETTAGTGEGTVDEPNEAPMIELGVGVGPVKLGMSKDEVIQCLGQPDRTEEPMPDVIVLDYISSRGIDFGLHPTLGVNYIKCYWDKYPGEPDATAFAKKTRKGVAMGASRDEIVAAYGEPDETASKGPFTILYYNSLSSEMLVTDDGLVGIKMVKVPQ